MRTTPASHVILKKPLSLGGDPWAMSNLASTCSTCRALHVDVEFEPPPATPALPPTRSPPQLQWWNRD
ncbi:MAG: hypothetical protein LCH56_05880 [Proteobacteria bacterium]|nr:hypothetical protein [Pseudomonadota bacterium]